MSQIILQERTAHLARYTFLQEMLGQCYFHRFINHQEYLFHRTLSSRHGCISDASLRSLIQRLREVSKRAELQISSQRLAVD